MRNDRHNPNGLHLVTRTSAEPTPTPAPMHSEPGFIRALWERASLREKLTASASVGILAVGLVAGVQEFTKPTPEEQQITQIIESPNNIPKGHSVTIHVEGQTNPTDLSQVYGAKGHIDELREEFVNQEVESEHGKMLPIGEIQAYDEFIDPKVLADLQQQNSAGN